MANQVLYGFIGLKDVLGQRLSTVDAELITGAIQQSVDEHNRQMDALMSLFVSPVTSATERYKQTGPARLQPLDENGRAQMTVQDANDATAQMLEADMRWMRDHILSALFASATWSFTDPQYGTLTVQPLANGDTVTYAVQTGADSGATDTHQLAQANAIGAGSDNPFPTIRNELLEHPENSGDVIVFLPTGLKAATQALATFNPIADPNIQPGSGTDRLVGTLGVATPGNLIGYEDSGVWLIEWPSLPANYMIATTTGGDRPVGMREDPEAELRGFKRVAERDNHPFYESQWLRRAGFGARNRVGAAVIRVGNGTYAVPTGYTPPMG